MQINGKDVPGKRSQSGGDGQTLAGRIGIQQLRQPPRQQDRSCPLGKIQEEDQDSRLPAEDPAHVCRSDVAATVLEEVHTVPAGDQVAERDRTDQVTDQNHRDEVKQGSHGRTLILGAGVKTPFFQESASERTGSS